LEDGVVRLGALDVLVETKARYSRDQPGRQPAATRCADPEQDQCAVYRSGAIWEPARMQDSGDPGPPGVVVLSPDHARFSTGMGRAGWQCGIENTLHVLRRTLCHCGQWRPTYFVYRKSHDRRNPASFL
jgi:hypothetical protein